MSNQSQLFVLIIGILATITSIAVLGYYNGLNALVPISLLYVLLALRFRSRLLGVASIVGVLAYVLLSCVTTVQ